MINNNFLDKKVSSKKNSKNHKVCYFYDNDVGNFYYGSGHPMKPQRIKMAHNLILYYGLHTEMALYAPKLASKKEMYAYHSEDYIDFLHKINPDNIQEYLQQLRKFNVGDDCPVFDGLYDFCQISAGGSINAAKKLNHGEFEVAINYAGGLHHAKKTEASGFCYVNDIVLGILELLKHHPRVLYIDIDIHHGDGVQEAFYTSDRVMTCSFHKYGDYFPGTGSLEEIGYGSGKNFSVNVPLNDGIDNESYRSIFRPVLGKIMEVFKPGAVVLQCGADSLTGDRLGCFNMTIAGHSDCVSYMKTFGVPLLVLGGGGYTVRNVARCWAYEAATIVGKTLKNELPFNDYFEYYAPGYQLELEKSDMENLNNFSSLEKIKTSIFKNLNKIKGAPSVQIQEVPPDTIFEDEVDDVDLEMMRMDIKDSDYNSEQFGVMGIDPPPETGDFNFVENIPKNFNVDWEL